MREVRGWMDQPENQNEFVTLYIDNKNIRNEEDIIAFAAETEAVFGDILFRPTHKDTEYPNGYAGRRAPPRALGAPPSPSLADGRPSAVAVSGARCGLRTHSWPTINELVGRNRRILFEQQDDAFNAVNASASVFFTPTVWEGDQFGPSSFAPYPACTVSGASMRRVLTRTCSRAQAPPQKKITPLTLDEQGRAPAVWLARRDDQAATSTL